MTRNPSRFKDITPDKIDEMRHKQWEQSEIVKKEMETLQQITNDYIEAAIFGPHYDHGDDFKTLWARSSVANGLITSEIASPLREMTEQAATRCLANVMRWAGLGQQVWKDKRMTGHTTTNPLEKEV